MALELVEVRSRTRGKSPQMFSFKGVGKVTPRPVLDKDGAEIPAKDENGKIITQEVKQKDENGNEVTVTVPVPVTVDDIDATGVTNNIQEVVELFSQIPARMIKDEQGNDVPDPADQPLQRVIDGALNWFNVLARKAASPVTEVVTEDELTPIIAELVAAGFLKAEGEATWRRAVTTSAKLFEMERIDAAKMTKEYKALLKSKA